MVHVQHRLTKQEIPKRGSRELKPESLRAESHMTVTQETLEREQSNVTQTSATGACCELVDDIACQRSEIRSFICTFVVLAYPNANTTDNGDVCQWVRGRGSSLLGLETPAGSLVLSPHGIVATRS